MSHSERQKIIDAYYVSTSAVRPGTEELVPRLFRMSAFMPTNTPISFGMLMSPPTLFYTILWQTVNQSYMATLNYQNKNASSVFTNLDLVRGFSLAVTSALFVSISLRKITSGLTKTATGSRLLFLNALVGSVASGTAGFCNTTCIR